jgi:glutamyl/glutaminyl-tRNA synthetase
LSVNDIKPGKAMPIIRVALVGKLEGPDLFDLIVFLGKKEVTRRVSFLERSFNNFTS